MNSDNLKPEVGSAYGYAWSRMWKYFLELFLIAIVGWVIGVPAGTLSWFGGIGFPTFPGLFGYVYVALVLSPVEYGISYAYLKAARDERVEVKDMFAAFNNYWNTVLAGILVGAIVVIGFILFIIPGFYLACKLAFTPYLVVDRKMEVTEALRESWRMTDGHAWTVLGIGLLGVVISIAGIIVFFVGVIVATMWITLALASLYYTVSRSQPAPSQ